MKKIAVFVIIAALVGGIGYFIIHSKTQPQTNSSVQSGQGVGKIVKTKQMQSAENYFKTFTDCMKHTTEASGQLGVYCQSHNKYAGKDLEANLEKQNSFVVCGQNPPKSVTAKRTTEINDNQALVIVKEDSGPGTIDVMYQMQREGGEWKVVNIVCPK